MNNILKQNESLLRSAVNVETVTCNYCGKQSKLITGQGLYPGRPDLWKKKFWECVPCDAYVGCHPGTDVPLGKLANSSLRVERVRAHYSFDPLWKPGEKKVFKSRKKAYAWLADRLKIKPSSCHIGLFDEDMCNKVIEIAEERTGA